jgi:hypothetical protein
MNGATGNSARAEVLANGKKRKQIIAPACNKCRGTSHLVTAEPHPRFEHTDLRTFQCDTCGAMQTVTAPLPHG